MPIVHFTPLLINIVLTVFAALVIIIVTLFCYTFSTNTARYRQSNRYYAIRIFAILGVIIMMLGGIMIIMDHLDDWKRFDPIGIGFMFIGGLSSLCIVLWELIRAKVYYS